MQRFFAFALPLLFLSALAAQAQLSSSYTFQCADSSGNTYINVPLDGFFYQNTTSTINFSVVISIDHYVEL